MTEDLKSIAKTRPPEPKSQDFNNKINKHDFLHKQLFTMKELEVRLAQFKELIKPEKSA